MVAKFRLCRFEAKLKRLATVDLLALRRGMRADARQQGTRVEIRVRGRRIDKLHMALNAHLALQLHPVKGQRRPLRLRQFAALAALIIAVKNKAALLHILE